MRPRPRLKPHRNQMQPPDRPQRCRPLLSQLLQRRGDEHPDPLVRGQDHRCPILSRILARRNGHTRLPRMLMPHSLVPQSSAELDTGGRDIRNGEPKTALTGRSTPQPASLSAATPTLHFRYRSSKPSSLLAQPRNRHRHFRDISAPACAASCQTHHGNGDQSGPYIHMPGDADCGTTRKRTA